MNFKNAPTLPEGMFDTAKPNPMRQDTVPAPWCGDRSMTSCCHVCTTPTRFIFLHADMLPSFVCSEECLDKTDFRGSYIPAPMAPALPVEANVDSSESEVLDGEDICCTGFEGEADGVGGRGDDGVLPPP